MATGARGSSSAKQSVKQTATPAARRRAQAEAEASRAAGRRRLALGLGAIALAVVLVASAGFVIVNVLGASSTSGQWTEQGVGGSWTDVSVSRLAQMLQTKDFTLINVKTPYMGEIDGTDLWIPYDQIAADASELPAAKNAKILVYCRSGVESRQAAQTLLDLGYTNVWNLDGGMNAWTSSGRQLVQKNR